MSRWLERNAWKASWGCTCIGLTLAVKILFFG